MRSGYRATVRPELKWRGLPPALELTGERWNGVRAAYGPETAPSVATAIPAYAAAAE